MKNENKFKINFWKIQLPPVRPTPPLRRGDLRSVKRACKVWPRNSVSWSSFTALKKGKYLFSCICILNRYRWFLIKLGIKPHLHLWEVGILSLNSVIVRPTKIMNDPLKVCKNFGIKNQPNLSDFFSVKNIWLGNQLL